MLSPSNAATQSTEHYELFTRALDDPMLKPNSVVVHPTCSPSRMTFQVLLGTRLTKS